MPDLGISSLDDVLTDVRRITDVCDLPLLVDVDTGFGASAFNIARTVRSLDQGRRRGHAHRGPGRRQALRPPPRQGARLAGRDGRPHQGGGRRAHRRDFVIMARTDALAVEGLDAAIERAMRVRRGRRRHDLPRGRSPTSRCTGKFADAVKVPVLANITEFGKTPLFTLDELRSAGVAIALYPLSAFRAMNKAALNVYETLRRDGTQKSVVDAMQTRDELYEYLGLPRLRAEARRAVRMKALPPMNDSRPSPLSPRSPSRSPASPPATPRCAPSAAPATTCTTAATTSSTSPTTCRVRGDRLPAGARQAAERGRAGRATRQKLQALRGLPADVQDGARAAARRARIRWT